MTRDRFRYLINTYVGNSIDAQLLLDHEREMREDIEKTYEAKKRAMIRHPELQITGRPNADFIDDISVTLSATKEETEEQQEKKEKKELRLNAHLLSALQFKHKPL